MSVRADKAKILKDIVLFDDNVNLAAALGPLSVGGPSPPINLVVDCECNNTQRIRRLTKTIADRLQIPVAVFRLADARPAALLMRQVLDEADVLKDHHGQWSQLLEEHDLIVGEAEAQEQWQRTLRSAVTAVLNADDGITLAVEFGPLPSERDNGRRHDMNLLLGCTTEGMDGPFPGAFGRLQRVEFRIQVIPLSQAREFPFALSHIVRTGQVLKDSNDEWLKILSERDQIIDAGRAQQAAVALARRLRSGNDSAAEFN